MKMRARKGFGRVACGLAALLAAGVLTGTAAAATGQRTLTSGSPHASSWTRVSTPSTATASSLSSISCRSATFCVAVGNQQTGPAGQTNSLIEAWNGASWSVVPSPNKAGASQNNLESVACSSKTRCFAVGQDVAGTTEAPIVEAWNGTTWTLPSQPTFFGYANMQSVTCPGSAPCIAAGGTNQNPSTVEESAGKVWKRFKPRPANTTYLFGISCPSWGNCVAVGLAPGSAPEVDSWNGTKWTETRLPMPVTASPVYVEGISCVSASDCMVAGWYNNSAGDHPVAWSWNGSTAAISTPVDPGGSPDESLLYGISCTSSTECVAVGYTSSGSNVVPLAEDWNGTSWSLIPTDDSVTGYLTGVSCVGSKYCAAAGWTQSGTTVVETGAP